MNVLDKADAVRCWRTEVVPREISRPLDNLHEDGFFYALPRKDVGKNGI